MNPRYRVRKFALLWLLLIPSAYAQNHDGHTAGMSHGSGSIVTPVETGQSAFAAIAEIVTLLEADPRTNWSTVDIDALRSHLVDMDLLMLSANVDTQYLNGQTILFNITGQGETLQAIQAMVPTHALMVGRTTDWKIRTILEPDGVILTIDPGSAKTFVKLKALGFFGFMTIGAHHQVHHFQMATGKGH